MIGNLEEIHHPSEGPSKNDVVKRVVVVPFAGSNEEHEIETFDEFLCKVDRELGELGPEATIEDVSLDGWVFQGVSFVSSPALLWERYNFKGSHFWGCELPDGVSAEQMRSRGVDVLENPPDLPFKPFRAFLYRQEELCLMDQLAYQYHLKHRAQGVRAAMMMAVHDHSIRDALYDFLEGKTLVVVMGGHGMRRASADYVAVTKLAWMLAKQGFVIATGGGPGAMEAANLGAYLRMHDSTAIDRVMEIFQSYGDSARGYADACYEEAALAVLEEFGMPTFMPSLGIPTWKYGHEPPNKFATYHAKMFSNAIREDGLVQIGNAGIIYTPGRAGTRQEIFQAACKNHYASKGGDSPMIFWKKSFWSNGESEYFDLVKRSAGDLPYSKWLLCTDSLDEIVAHIIRFREERRLPIVTMKDMMANHWMKS